MTIKNPQSIIHDEGNKRKLYVLYPCLILLVAIGFGLINLPRKKHLTSDQVSLGTEALRSEEPELFKSSMLYGTDEHFRHYLPWYRKWMSVVQRVTGDIFQTYLLAMFAITLVTLFAWYWLFLGLGLKPGFAFFGAIMGTLPRMSLGKTLWGAGVIETVLPRMFFSMLFPLVILVLYRNSFKWWAVFLGFFCVGLLGNLHPMSGVFAACILGMMVLFYFRFRPLGWLLLVGGGLCARVGIAPFMIMSAQWRSQLSVRLAEGAAKVAVKVAAKGAAKGAAKVAPQDMSVIVANLIPDLLVFGSCLAPVLLAVFICTRLKPYRKDRLLRILVWVTFATIVFSMVNEVFVWRFRYYWLGDWMAMFHWSRGTRFVAFFGVLTVMLCIGRMDAAVTRRQWLIKIMLVGLLLVPVVSSIGGMEYFYRTHYQSVEEAAAWGSKTPKGTRFLVDSKPAATFRIQSQRPVLIASHDVQFFAIVPKKFKKAKLLNKKIRKIYEERRWFKLLQLARDEKIPYVVAPSDAEDVMKPVFKTKNGQWVFSSELPPNKP